MKKQDIFETAKDVKEMVYASERKREVLATGNYMGVDYIIVSYGTHPCSYIKIEKGNPFYGKEYDDIPIDCHCGLTFGQVFKTDKDASVMGFPKGHWIGWDYAHCDDYSPYLGCGTKHTTTDLLYGVRTAIESLLEISDKCLSEIAKNN
jgi:hypothetical protein